MSSALSVSPVVLVAPVPVVPLSPVVVVPAAAFVGQVRQLFHERLGVGPRWS
jgi:hypothetical protein